MTLLRQINDELDAAVAEAYGWPADLTDDEILRRHITPAVLVTAGDPAAACPYASTEGKRR